jgi:hypothetical protein
MADKIIIDIDVQGDAEVKLKRIGAAAEEATSGIKKSFLDAGRITDNFIASIASNAVGAAFNALSNAVSGTIGFISDSAKEAAEAEENVNNLKIALKSAGVVSEQSAQNFLEFASAVQTSTKYSDDAVLSAGALIQQLGKLDEEGLEKATQAALDLSAALGIDLQSAAQLVGKAANGEIGTFKRYGIAIKEGGDIAETFANTLDTINARFGGSAAAQVNTYAGAQAKLANQFGELKETIGNVIIQNPVLIKLTQALSDAFIAASQYVNENKAALSGLLSGGIILMVQGIEAAVYSVQVLSLGLLKLTEVYLESQRAISKIAQYVPGIIGQTAKLSIAVADEALPKIRSGMDALVGPVDKFRNSLVTTINSLKEAQLAQESAAVRATQATIQGTDLVISKEGLLTDTQQSEREKREAARLKEVEDEIALIQANNELLIQQDKFKNEELIRQGEERAIALSSQEEKLQAKTLDLKKKALAREADYERDRLQAGRNSLNALASLQGAKTREIAAVGKAAAIAQATIDTYSGASAAAAALAGIPVIGPGLAVGAAAAFIAAGLFRVAQISGVELATGITEVPAGFPNDSFPARLTSGERVVDAGTNQDLKAFLSGGGASAILQQILERIERLETNVTVNVGSRTIIDEVRDGIRSGRVVNV